MIQKETSTKTSTPDFGKNPR
uniref:Uncharacterized protein n=1 Tax=Anguilla anguilla TaxID=7936 RepID=A0A0E9PUY8_ANGAN